jgi:DNA processing protein
MNDLIYKIGINLIKEVGPINAKKLIAYCGGADAVFKESKAALMKIPDIGPVVAHSILNQNVLQRAEQEITFIEKYNIKPLYFLDQDFPFRLKQCEDSPIILYTKGNIDLNKSRMVSIVGMRKASNYGKDICEKLVEALKPYNVTIISGLAYGIDICAHKAALKNNISTAGVLAHGLDRIYPAVHKIYAEQMLDKGGLITEYISESKPDREHFPARNRVVAGLCDATIVIESAIKGGSLITAELANAYNRDVFAVPGRINDDNSAGCNKLIRINKAHLLEGIENIEYIMNWQKEESSSAKEIQTNLFLELTDDEKKVMQSIVSQKELSIDQICIAVNMPMSKVAGILLNLEFSGQVKALPGKSYRAI